MTHASTPAPRRQPVANSPGFELKASLFVVLIAGGVYLDGWAHNHDRVDQSFLTPWHAVLYAGIATAGAFFGISALSNHSRGSPWRESLPAGYLPSVAGVGLFLAAGLVDLVWHALFGIERDTAALLSPTHLALALGGVLIGTGPWRSALVRLPAGVTLSWSVALPLLLSVAGVIGVLAFMTQFAHPLVDTLATRERPRPSTPADVYVMNADGSNQTRVTVDSETWDGFGVWSPDGKKLLVTSGKEPQPSDLFVMNPDGTGAVQLTHTPGSDYSMSWSPDGTKVAFVSNVGPVRHRFNADVFVINADGSDLKQLTQTPKREWGTSWSPDSKRIAYSADVDKTWQVMTMNADGSDQRRLTSGSRHSVGPTWSPDGKTIAFQRDAGNGRLRVHVMDADGANVRALAGTGNDDYHPSWSPKGDRLAFTSYKDGRNDIYFMRADGSEAQNLTRSAGAGYDSAAWSPDGERIVFTGEALVTGQDHELMRRLGVASIVLQSALLMAPLLLAVRRWRLPFGSVTLVLGLTALAASVLRDHYVLLPGVLLAGLGGDVLLQSLGQRSLSEWGLRTFAVVLPMTLYALYFLTLALDSHIDWTVHLWAGSVVIAGVVGLGLSYLVKARE